MALFLLIALNDAEPAIGAAVASGIEKDSRYLIEPGKWMIDSPVMTCLDLADTLELAPPVTFLIIPVRGNYWGCANQEMWEWITAAEYRMARIGAG
jgi:hypothetical protein